MASRVSIRDDAGMPLSLMLATLTDRRDFGEDWLLERKLDGERCVARKDGGGCGSNRVLAKTSPVPTPRSGLR
jgi:ATP-dependent DNA ligase